MAIKKVPNLRSKTFRNGTRAWYWEPQPLLRAHGWQAVALGKDEGEAFAKAEKMNEQVEQWRKRAGAVPQHIKPLPERHTLPAVIAHFKSEQPGKPAWPSIKREGDVLKVSTRAGHETAFKRIEEWAQDVPLKLIGVKQLQDFKKALITKHGYAPARSTMATLRMLFTYARREGLFVGDNPAEKMGMPGANRRHVIWDRGGGTEDMEAMKAGAIAAGYPELCLAFDLFELLGQREADMLKLRCDEYREIPRRSLQQLGREDIETLTNHDGPHAGKVMGFYFVQGKTREPMGLAVAGPLRQAIERAIERNTLRGIPTILVDEHFALNKLPRPWVRNRDFWKAFDAARDKAVELSGRPELKQLTIHDLRRTAIVRLGELGLADQFIAAVSGHSLRTIKEILEIYMPRNEHMAAKALAARVRSNAERDTLDLRPEPPRARALPAPVEPAPIVVEPIVATPEPVAVPSPNIDEIVAAAVAAALRAHGIEPTPVVGAAAAIEEAVQARLAAERSALARKGGLARKGADRGGAKLSDDAVIYIKRNKGKVPQKELARRVGVSFQLVSLIHTGRNWTHLEDDGRALPAFP